MLIKARAQAQLPTTKHGAAFICTAYEIDGHEYACAICGDITQGEPHVRIQSGCVYGTAFGSADCYCRAEIKDAMRLIAAEKCGIVVYSIHKEGRGVSLVTKTIAMANRHKTGCDSAVDLSAIGLDKDDYRQYDEEIAIMRDLRLSPTIRMLSKNGGKRKAVENAGYRVIREYDFDRESCIWQPVTAG